MTRKHSFKAKIVELISAASRRLPEILMKANAEHVEPPVHWHRSSTTLKDATAWEEHREIGSGKPRDRLTKQNFKDGQKRLQSTEEKPTLLNWHHGASIMLGGVLPAFTACAVHQSERSHAVLAILCISGNAEDSMGARRGFVDLRSSSGSVRLCIAQDSQEIGSVRHVVCLKTKNLRLAALVLPNFELLGAGVQKIAHHFASYFKSCKRDLAFLLKDVCRSLVCNWSFWILRRHSSIMRQGCFESGRCL